jgi:Ca2+-binding EF-hand superfamily protein
MSTAKMLATRQDRDRWFKILDRRCIGLVDRSDLVNYAEKLDLTQDKALELFNRLDSDKDGFLNAQEWDRSGVLLAYEGLVRAENHPM